MKLYELYERPVHDILALRFPDLTDTDIVDVARQMHKLERRLQSLPGKQYRKLIQDIHNAKIDLVTEMRKRGIRIMTLFTESRKITESVDADYYMEEGCGIFAIALSRLKPGGEIYILSNVGLGAETWNEDIPYEVTHVFYRIDDKTYDVRGIRSPSEMAHELYVNEYDIKGPWQPEEFIRRFMGETDEFPLYGGEEAISEAINFIKRDQRF